MVRAKISFAVFKVTHFDKKLNQLKIDFTHKGVQWATLILLALVWGSSFILMKLGLKYFSANEVAAYRMSAAMIVLLPIALRNLGQLRKYPVALLASGLFGNAIPAFLFATAQTEIPSALSGILNSLTSLFTLLIGILFFRFPVLKAQIAGVIIAFIGAMGLIGFEEISSFGTYGRYASLVIIASACYGTGVNVIKRYLHDVRPTHITALSFMLVSPWLTIYLFSKTNFVETLTEQPEAWWGVFYLTILAAIGTAFAVILFNRLIKETTAVFASSVTYMIPIVALGWGILDGEEMGLQEVSFMVLILLGIFLINSKKTDRLLERILGR